MRNHLSRIKSATRSDCRQDAPSRGSERSLFDLIAHFDRTRFEPVVWCNQRIHGRRGSRVENCRKLYFEINQMCGIAGYLTDASVTLLIVQGREVEKVERLSGKAVRLDHGRNMLVGKCGY